MPAPLVSNRHLLRSDCLFVLLGVGRRHLNRSKMMEEVKHVLLNSQTKMAEYD